MEANFGPLEERIKNDWNQSRLNISEEQPVHFLAKEGMKKFCKS